MKRKLLAITLTLAMLAGLFSVAGLSASAATNFGTPVLTADDLPDSPNLIAGKTPVGKGDGSAGAPNTNSSKWANATDGLVQGVNQKAKFKLTESPTYTYSGVQYMQPKVPADWVAKNYPELDANKAWYLSMDRWGPLSDIGETRTVTYAYAEETEQNKANGRPIYDLGAPTKVEKVMLAISAEIVGISGLTGKTSADGTSNQTITADKLEAGLAPKAVSASPSNTFFKVNVYVADKMDANIRNAENLVLSWDNTDAKTSMSLAAVYDVDTVKMGRYVCIDFHGCNYSNLTRFSELAVYGKQVSYTNVDEMSDLPEGKSLITGKTPTKADGSAVSKNSGEWVNITDGKMQGLNQVVKFVLSQDESAKTATKNGNTYYSWIANEQMLKDYGLDPTETWYLVPENTQWLKGTQNEQRAVLANWAGAGGTDGRMVYDMLTENTIESVLLASSTELDGLTNYNTSGPNKVISDSDYVAMNKFTYDKKLLWTAKVYVGNDKATIFDEKNLVLKYDLSSSINDALRSLWTLPEAATGRYVAFDFSDCVGPNTLVRISELGVYGSTVVDTYSADELAANVPAAASNALKNAVGAWYRASNCATSVHSSMTGALVDGEISLTNKLCPAESAAEYFYFTYDLETAYNIDSLFYAGDGSTGANSVGVYVGDKTIEEIETQGLEPDYFYDGGIGNSFVSNNKTGAQGIKFDVELTGRYVTFRLGTCKNSGQQVWVSEFAATGSPVTINTAGGQLRNAEATDKFAVRFGFHMATDSIGYVDADPATSNNYARAELGADSKTTINGKEVQVVDFGAVVSNQTGIEADGLTLEACAGSGTIKKVPANNLYAVKDGYITYTAVVKDIPAAAAERDLYARPYIQYMDGDDVVTIYGDMFATAVANYLK